MKLFLNTSRTGYTPGQCGDTLTVGELIDILAQYDEDDKVFFRNDDGYTYGSIDEDDFEYRDDE